MGYVALQGADTNLVQEVPYNIRCVAEHYNVFNGNWGDERAKKCFVFFLTPELHWLVEPCVPLQPNII